MPSALLTIHVHDPSASVLVTVNPLVPGLIDVYKVPALLNIRMLCAVLTPEPVPSLPAVQLNAGRLCPTQEFPPGLSAVGAAGAAQSIRNVSALQPDQFPTPSALLTIHVQDPSA